MKTALIVDDHESNRKILAFLLSKKGWNFDMAEDGESAIISLNKNKYDIVFLDQMMPGLKGLDVLQWIRNQKLSCIVIMNTACRENWFEIEANKLGVDAIMYKPYSPSVVFEWLEKFE